jgi:hypothetical protein
MLEQLCLMIYHHDSGQVCFESVHAKYDLRADV